MPVIERIQSETKGPLCRGDHLRRASAGLNPVSTAPPQGDRAASGVQRNRRPRGGAQQHPPCGSQHLLGYFGSRGPTSYLAGSSA